MQSPDAVNGGSQRNPENIFFRARNFRKKLFWENPYTHSPANQNSFQLPKNLLKTRFSDVIAIVGSQGHLQPVSPEKPTVINAKKRCRQKPAKLHGFIRFKMDILAK